MPTLLIVDDETNLLSSLKKGLQSDKLQVITAETAKQGIDVVRKNEPDAMILDVRLPDMSGLDAFNEIRSIDARLPVIIITADFLPETCHSSLAPPEDDSRSPIDVDGIRQHVRTLLAENRQDIYHKLHNEIDRILLPEVLCHVDGNQAQASELLGIARSTLRTKIGDLGLTFEKRLKAESDRAD